ncbi:hypothetical protein HN873_006006 [Arachis hypogaea]
MFPAFPNLRLLTIKRCENLRSLEMMSELQFLWQLSIKSRLKLDNIRLPASLSELRIGECPLFGEWQRTPSNASLQDESRVKYLHGYIGATLDALRNGSKIKGFFAWTFLDLFELLDGYKVSYALSYVDRNDPELKRYPKLSAKWFNLFLRGRRSTSIVGAMKLVKDPSHISI